MKLVKNKEPKSGKANGLTKIHNVRFYNLPPRAINCMDFEKTNKKLALARNDGSIEIWDMEHTPYLEKTAPKITSDTSIDSIAWAGNRLFSAGLSGEVAEWDMMTMKVGRQQRVTGEAIWCLRANRQCTELAIGTEEGYINIFDIESGGFEYKQLFDKQEGRVLCCAYDITGNYLVTGSVKVLRVWNVKTGHAVRKMTLPKGVDKNDPIIWALKVLDDFSIIVGDSRGCITVYDGHTGDHLEAHQVLKADILALSVNEAQDMLVCSGVDPVIRIYARTMIKREDTTFYRWIKYLQRAVHNHDVKALLCIPEDRIISGGVDGYLGVSFLTRMRSIISRQGPFLKHPCATIADKANALLLHYPEHLELWRLSDTTENNGKQRLNNTKGKSMALNPTPIKVFQLESKNAEPILCSTISPDGKKICYSTMREVRLFNYTFDKSGAQGQLQRTRNSNKPPECSSPMSHMCYSHDSQRLFLVSRFTKQLHILKHLTQDEDNDLTLVETIDLSNHLKGCITHFTLSPNSKCFVIADDQHTIAVFRIGVGKRFEHCLDLARYEAAAVTAIALHARIPCVVVAFTDGRLVEYDIEKALYTCWCDQSLVVPNAETHCTAQILLDERNPDIIILRNDGYLYTLEKYTPENAADQSFHIDNNIDNKGKTKKPKNIAPPFVKERNMFSLRSKLQKPYEHLLFIGWLSSNELVAISVNENLLIKDLSPAFVQKKYGVS